MTPELARIGLELIRRADLHLKGLEAPALFAFLQALETDAVEHVEEVADAQ